MKKLLLDTNGYTALLSGDTAVLDALGAADTVYMSVFVLGELFAGFAGGKIERENREVLNRFLGKVTVKMLNATVETADIFGMLKSRLKGAGTPLPINDVWIASHAIETGSVLVTYDTHFKKVAGIRIWNDL